MYNSAGATAWRRNMYTSHRKERAFQNPEAAPQAFGGTLTFTLILLVLILLCVLALYSGATH